MPPGPPGLPWLGHFPQLRSNALGFVTALARTYGPAATFCLGQQPVVLLSRPEAIRSVLVERARSFTNAEFNAVLRPVLGRGLLTTDGEEHRRLRRLVQPAFGRKRVEGYRDIMAAQAERMLASWEEGIALDMGRQLQHLTLNIVAEVLLSLRMLDQVEALGEAFAAATDNARQASLLMRTLRGARGTQVNDDRFWHSPLMRVPLTPQYRVARARGVLDSIVGTLIAQKRAEGMDRGDVVSALLAARDESAEGANGNVAPVAERGGLSDDEIRDQLLTLLAAGHATTAIAMAWTLYLLSRNPQAAGRLRDELRRNLGGRAPTAEDLESLPYLDLVWCEALRLYPPAWALGRLAREEIAIEGYRIPPGVMLMLSPWVTHRLPSLYESPHAFCPERFEPENSAGRPPYAYFPFGGGPRMCIGAAFAALEGKLILAMILQRFAPALLPDPPVVPAARVVLRPAHGLHMRLDLATA
jgi:cytochrome P450